MARSFLLGGCEYDENVIDFEWLGECDVSADYLLNSESGVESDSDSYETSESGAVSAYISGMLKNGPRSAREMIDTAIELGFSERTLNRVKKTMGVKSVRDDSDGALRLWTLPNDTQSKGGNSVFTGINDSQIPCIATPTERQCTHEHQVYLFISCAVKTTDK